MNRWDLTSLTASTQKRRPREPGSDAPREPRGDLQMPRVLFTAPECRVIVIELENGETMGDHRVRERALVQVVTGRATIESSGMTVECDAGTLVIFEPSERHTVRALQPTRLLLILAPWPAPSHYTGAEKEHAQHLPANAVVASMTQSETVAGNSQRDHAAP